MLVDRGSLLRKVSDRQLMSESINFNSISNMIYGISSMIYGIGASIDISVRSVLRESRPGFPARGHDSESKRLQTLQKYYNDKNGGRKDGGSSLRQHNDERGSFDMSKLQHENSLSDFFSMPTA